MKMMKFAKRNLLEIIRDPLSLIFCIGFPVIMLFIFELIYSCIPVESRASVPQFQIERLAPSLVVFGFSFLPLFAGMLVAKDRTTSFLARLRTSPMKSIDFTLGYMLPLLPIALFQTLFCYGCSMFFGLKITINFLFSLFFFLPIVLFFIAIGLLLGTLVNDKAVGGVASLLINFVAIFSGMFMPLEFMGNTIQVIAKIFPFYNALQLIEAVMHSTYNYSDFFQPLGIVCIYTIVATLTSIWVFQKKMHSDFI